MIGTCTYDRVIYILITADLQQETSLHSATQDIVSPEASNCAVKRVHTQQDQELKKTSKGLIQNLMVEKVKGSSQPAGRLQEQPISSCLSTDLDEHTQINHELNCLYPLSNYVFSDAYSPNLVRLDLDDSQYQVINLHFQREWVKPTYFCPIPMAIFKIANRSLLKGFNAYRFLLKTEYHFHGTSLKCNMLEKNKFCDNSDCGICGISKSGFDLSCVRSRFQRFGKGIYLAPNSSKCHDYTSESQYGCRAQLLCLVACGVKYELYQNEQSLVAPPSGYHSVYGKAAAGGKLNYDEIVLYNVDAVLPQYIIVYSQQGAL